MKREPANKVGEHLALLLLGLFAILLLPGIFALTVWAHDGKWHGRLHSRAWEQME